MEILYLEPYSPFLNPIKKMFSKWKNIVKRTNLINEFILKNVIGDGESFITENVCNS